MATKDKFQWVDKLLYPQYNELHGLPYQLSESEKEAAIKLTNGFIYAPEFATPHIGVYDEKGQHLYDELGALDAAIKVNDLEFIEYLDGIVPIGNKRYTTFSFSAKKILESGFDFETRTYLMRDDSGLTKIGMAKNPTDRQRQLVKDFPSIKLIAECPYYCERELHLLFRNKRVVRHVGRGNNSVEWFDLTEQDVLYIYRNYNFYDYESK